MPVSVLLIEGSEDHAQAVTRALVDPWLDWRLLRAASVGQARALLAGERIDIVLVARRLHDGSAYDVFASLQGQPTLMGVHEGEEAGPPAGRGHAGAPAPSAAGHFAGTGTVHCQCTAEGRLRGLAARGAGADPKRLWGRRSGGTPAGTSTPAARACHHRYQLGRCLASALCPGGGTGHGV